MAKKKNKRRADYKAPAAAAGKSSAKTPAEASTKQQARAVPARPSGNRAASRRGETASALSWWLLGGGIAAVVVAVIVFSSIGGESQEGVTDATSWELPALVDDNDPDGDGQINLADFRGTPVVLNFFASWCTACEAELPLFRQASDDFEGEIQVLFINSNETGNWEPMAERTGIMDQILIDDIGGSRNNGLYRSLGGTGGMPLTAWYDADGNLTNVRPGQYDGNGLYTAIEAAIGS